MTLMDLYRRLPRPTLMWIGAACLPIGMLQPEVDASKLGILTGFLVLLFGIREGGKALGNE